MEESLAVGLGNCQALEGGGVRCGGHVGSRDEVDVDAVV